MEYSERIHIQSGKMFFLFFLIILLLYNTACPGPEPVPTGSASDQIDILNDPVQTPVEHDTSILLKVTDGEFTITLLDHYTLAGVLVSRKTFSKAWESLVVPVDLAICWGKVAQAENLKYVGFSQRGRWYYFKVGTASPFDKAYVYLHSANNHIVPANNNILLAVKAAKKKKPIVLEGYLANINGTYKGKTYWWHTSRVRSDRGQGSCELFYVTRVRIDNHYYE